MSRRVITVLFGAAFVFGFALACSSGRAPAEAGPFNPDGSGQPGDAGMLPADAGADGLPLESACDTINEARCAFLQRCGLLGEDEGALADCERYFSATDCGPARWPSRVQQGTLRYHPEFARSCADDWRSSSCEDFQKVPSSCGSVTSAAALLGGACYGGPTPECVVGVCTGGTCPRHCRAPGAQDELCESDSDCQSPLYCRPTSSGSTVGTCAEPGLAGQSCAANQPCGAGLYCGDFSICATVHQPGEPCTPGSCEAQAWCDYGPNGATCVARASQGQSCTEDLHCQPGLLCLEESGTCEPEGPLPLQSPCGRRQRCAPGLACVGTGNLMPSELGSCLPAVQRDGSCTSSYDCAEPWACDFERDGGQCASRRDDAEDCSADRDCQLFSRCLNGSCTRLPTPGEACPFGACQFGACVLVPDAGLRCSSGLDGNAPCAHDEECASLQCVSGACIKACTP